MRIAADGTWFHEGGVIRREAMVRAFAGLLTRDDAGHHWLVTPFEKLAIEVEDAAFIAVDCVRADDALVFRLNTDDIVIAGPDHPLRAAGSAENRRSISTCGAGARRGSTARPGRSWPRSRWPRGRRRMAGRSPARARPSRCCHEHFRAPRPRLCGEAMPARFPIC
jgi:hypothetical protein